MNKTTVTFESLQTLFKNTGLVVRGGFVPLADDAAFLSSNTKTVILIGNTGREMWPFFAKQRHTGCKDPLDHWTYKTVKPIADRLNAEVLFPFNQPHPPFQRWAMRAESLHTSPLGLLIHPQYGLWHAYRAALAFQETITFPEVITSLSPCSDCDRQPCLLACPVNAFSQSGYDVSACAHYLSSKREPSCLQCGCHARNACPIGTDHHYEAEQIAFHMTAFYKSITSMNIVK